ncbi:MAG: FAD-linked oxidase C-terminal domain-containing protein [Phycisphaeraceae bacterium]
MAATVRAWHPVIDDLRRAVGDANILSDPDELMVYECDGFPVAKGLPIAVVFPTTTQQVSRCLQALSKHDVQVVARGSGTGLAGGCVAFGDGVLIATSRMTTIETIDLDNRLAVVQAGVRNTALSDAVAARCRAAGLAGALHFSPDPSSQRASTVGGNAATNAGGISTLKHGVTSNHILGIEMVLPDGTILQTRADSLYDGIGADLPGLICGSEGTLGIITRLWCRLVPKPAHFRTVYGVFASTADACQTVSDTIASGLMPASMEIMDGAMVRVVEDAFHYGFPTDAQALLLMEVDGVAEVLDAELETLVQLCRKNRASDVKFCSDPKRRAELWSARKKAFGAIGRISRSYCTQDACIPRSLLAQAVVDIGQIGARHGLKITSVFHAGDGNVHPILLFDEEKPAQVQCVLRASTEILEYCISIGGTITGEHGVGVEKLHLMNRLFGDDTIDAFTAIKAAFDPQHRCNEGKLIPSDRVRIELLRPTTLNSPGGAS